MKYLILKTGLFRKSETNNELKQELNLNNWIKKFLAYFHIAFVDPCCPKDSTLLPTSYNEDTNELRYWDGTIYRVANCCTNSSICFNFNLYNKLGSTVAINIITCDGLASSVEIPAFSTVVQCAQYVETTPNIVITNEGLCQ